MAIESQGLLGQQVTVNGGTVRYTIRAIAATDIRTVQFIVQGQDGELSQVAAHNCKLVQRLPYTFLCIKNNDHLIVRRHRGETQDEAEQALHNKAARKREALHIVLAHRGEITNASITEMARQHGLIIDGMQEKPDDDPRTDDDQ